MTDLARPATRGLGWAGIGTIVPMALQFIGLLILARILTPSDFGLASLASTVSAFAVIFVNSGLGAFVVHVEAPTQRLLSTVFWINAGMGVLIAGVVVALAWPISAGLEEARLPPLLMLSAIGFVLGVSATHLALLERGFRFRAIAAVDVIAMTLNLGVAITLAMIGIGPESIVFGLLAGQALQMIGYWIATGWRPSFILERGLAAIVWRYAGHVLGFNAINYWSRNLDNLVIGWGGQSVELGYYSRSYQLMLLPVSLIPTVVGRVLLPVIARLQDDLRAASRIWSEHIVFSLTVGLPLAGAMIAMPGLIITVLLGEQWGSAAYYLLVLGFGIPPQLVLRAAGALQQALGRTRAFFVNGLINTAVMVAAILLGYWLDGAQGVPIGVVIAFWLQLLEFLVYAKVWLGLELRRLLVPAAALFLLALLAIAATLGAMVLVAPLVPVIRLAIGVVVLLSAYIGFGILLARPQLTAVVRLMFGRG